MLGRPEEPEEVAPAAKKAQVRKGFRARKFGDGTSDITDQRKMPHGSSWVQLISSAHARADRYEALEPIHQSVHRDRGRFAKGISRNLSPCIMIAVRNTCRLGTEGNGSAERFIRTLCCLGATAAPSEMLGWAEQMGNVGRT